MNTKNTWTNFTMQTVRLLPADSPPGAGTTAEAETENTKAPIYPLISQTAEALEERFRGRCEASVGDAFGVLDRQTYQGGT
jgi:hypothetical protein